MEKVTGISNKSLTSSKCKGFFTFLYFSLITLFLRPLFAATQPMSTTSISQITNSAIIDSKNNTGNTNQGVDLNSMSYYAPLVNDKGTVVAILGEMNVGTVKQPVLNLDGKGFTNFILSSSEQIPDNGQVTPNNINTLIKQVVNSKDMVEAQSITMEDGKIVLDVNPDSSTNLKETTASNN